MTKLEYEIKRLEDELERMFNETKQFKGRSIAGKKTFEIELLRAELYAVSEKGQTNPYKLALLAVLVTFCLQFILSINLVVSVSSFITVILTYLLLVVLWLTAINLHGKTRELDTKGLALVDMLLERKRELDSGEENGN